MVILDRHVDGGEISFLSKGGLYCELPTHNLLLMQRNSFYRQIITQAFICQLQAKAIIRQSQDAN